MQHESAAAAPKTRGFPGDPFHNPFHAAGLRATLAQRLTLAVSAGSTDLVRRAPLVVSELWAIHPGFVLWILTSGLVMEPAERVDEGLARSWICKD
jgi:hypothetical protein